MKILFIGTNWITKWIITQILFEDDEEENELTIIGRDTPDWFYTEVPRLREYMGDERVDYKQVDLSDCAAEFDRSWPFDAVYVTDIEDHQLDTFLRGCVQQQFKGPIILASSWQVYGWKKKKRTPIKETDRELNPETNEGKHLLKLENVMLKYKQLQTVILRYGEVIGPYMPDGSEVINMMIDALSSAEIDVYPPPSRKYDWVHVKFIYGFVPRLFKRKFIGGGEIYNIGSGEEKKITWLANSLRQLTNSPATIKMHMPEEVEPRGYHSLLDSDKAKRHLQWDSDGIRIQSFLEIARWVEKDLDGPHRAPNLEDTYPMLKPEWGTNSMKVLDE